MAAQPFLRSLSGRTVLLSVGVAFVAAFVTIAVAIPQVSSAASAQARGALAGLAEVTAQALEDPRPGTVRRIQGMLQSQQGVDAFVISQGRLVPDLPVALQEAVLAGEEVNEEVEVKGKPFLMVGLPLSSGEGVVLQAPFDVARDPADQAIRQLLLALLVGIVVAGAVGYLASFAVTRPLRRVAETAEKLSSGERGVQLDPGGPTEVAEIAASLNDLSAALALSEDRQREFLLSISHEFRTPLTGIRGYAEALADGLLKPEDLAATGETMVAESERLDRLVADLLSLARLEAVDFPINNTVFDLVDMADTAAAVWGIRCDRDGVRFKLETPSTPVLVNSDPVRVRQIVDNLAENALRVTPAGGPIVLSITATGDTARISVRDGGPGLTDQDLAEAFTPAVLYHRYAGVRPVGSGVGLALVGRLATRLGGVASAESAPEGGAHFSVSLPIVVPTVDTP